MTATERSFDATVGRSYSGEIWFFTGSQEMYGPETLGPGRGPVAGDRRAARAARLPSSVTLVWKPVLTDATAIRRACLDANGDDGCIGVIAWMHTFSPAKMWIQGLDELRKPLLHLHTQANESLPWSTIDMDFMNLNQAAHGDREFAHVQTRLGVARKTVAGHISDPDGDRPHRHVGPGEHRGAGAAQPAASSASATTCATSR